MTVDTETAGNDGPVQGGAASASAAGEAPPVVGVPILGAPGWLAHPAAEMYPLMIGADFDELVEDIRKYGQKEEIVLIGELVLDGRNRIRACAVIGIEPKSKQWDGIGSPKDFVVSMNEKRRHLPEGQRIMRAARMATMKGGSAPAQKAASPIGEAPLSIHEAARLHDVAPRSVERGKAIIRDGRPEDVAAVESGKASVSKVEKQVKARKGAAGKGIKKATSRVKKPGTGDGIDRRAMDLLINTRFNNGVDLVALAGRDREEQLRIARSAAASDADTLQEIIDREFPSKRSKGAVAAATQEKSPAPAIAPIAPAEATEPAAAQVEPVTEPHQIHASEPQAIPPAGDAEPPLETRRERLFGAWKDALVLDRVELLSGLGLMRPGAELLAERPFVIGGDPDDDSVGDGASLWVEEASFVDQARRWQRKRPHTPDQRLAYFRAKVKHMSEVSRSALGRVVDVMTELNAQNDGGRGVNLAAEFFLAVARGAWEREQYSAVVKPTAEPVIGASPGPATSGAPEETKTTSGSREELQQLPAHSVTEASAVAADLEPREGGAKGGPPK